VSRCSIQACGCILPFHVPAKGICLHNQVFGLTPYAVFGCNTQAGSTHRSQLQGHVEAARNELQQARKEAEASAASAEASRTEAAAAKRLAAAQQAASARLLEELRLAEEALRSSRDTCSRLLAEGKQLKVQVRCWHG
jgi:hypothetical protein